MDDDARAQTANGLESRSSPDPVALTADIVSAYVTNNPVQPRDLAGLIASVHQALGTLGQTTEVTVEPAVPLSPAQIRKSISPDGMTSFIDGRIYKTLKRHLTAQGLTPQTYRERFGLPSDYPIVAPNYSAQRSAMAKSLGLGQIGRKVAVERVALAETPRGRGRPQKAETTDAGD